MLHGEIKINGQLIGSWKAVRQQGLTSSQQISDYKVETHWYSPRENFSFTVRHRYSDGADTLIAYIMTRSHELRTRRRQLDPLHDFGAEAQRAAEEHLEAIFAYEYGDEDDPEAPVPDFAGPYDGCTTCMVREVLHVAWPIAMRAAEEGVG